MKVVLHILNTSNFPISLNHTFISLIPKKAQATKAIDFRPICLCNVMYKLVSKVITNRLKIFLSSIISDS